MRDARSRAADPASRSAGHAMRVLYFAPKQCWPPDTGAKLRNFHLARELARRTRLTYLGFEDQTGAADRHARDEGELEDLCEELISVPLEGAYTLGKVVRGAFGRVPLTLLNYTTPAMKAELQRLLARRQFDGVQVEGVHLFEYLPIIRSAINRPLVICDWHNVESDLMRQYAQRAPTPWRRAYARLTARRMSEVERRALTAFDAHIVVSENDRARLLDVEPTARVVAIENGVDADHFSDAEIEQVYVEWLSSHTRREGAPDVKRVLFVGSMDYHANIEAATRFATTVWPSVHTEAPELVFTIVGRRPSDEVRALANLPGVEVTGTVDDVRPYYREAVASIVPLKVGGGSRLKILEAMAAGVPVVSTSLGAEGLRVTDGASIVIADSEEAQTRALLQLNANSELRRRLAEHARSLVRDRYDWSRIGAALYDVYVGSTRAVAHAAGLRVEVEPRAMN
ncbi:MAG TPA: glycosyltransferase [Blastocatellia bacterium]|nr:glycosyltransferase [Blastocatellia bacterium]